MAKHSKRKRRQEPTAQEVRWIGADKYVGQEPRSTGNKCQKYGVKTGEYKTYLRGAMKNRASSPALSLFMTFILFFMTFMPAPQAQGGRAGGAAPPTGTGAIIGRVLEAATTSGVAGTVVTLSGAGGSITQRVRVDSSGRFLFRDLPVGEFTVIARKAGFVGGAAGQRSPDGPSRPVELAEGERLTDLTLRLWQAGVIAG